MTQVFYLLDHTTCWASNIYCHLKNIDESKRSIRKATSEPGKITRDINASNCFDTLSVSICAIASSASTLSPGSARRSTNNKKILDTYATCTERKDKMTLQREAYSWESWRGFHQWLIHPCEAQQLQRHPLQSQYTRKCVKKPRNTSYSNSIDPKTPKLSQTFHKYRNQNKMNIVG